MVTRFLVASMSLQLSRLAENTVALDRTTKFSRSGNVAVTKSLIFVIDNLSDCRYSRGNER